MNESASEGDLGGEGAAQTAQLRFSEGLVGICAVCTLPVWIAAAAVCVARRIPEPI